MIYYAVVASFLSLTLLAPASRGQNISPAVDLQQNPSGMPNELLWSSDVQIGPKIALPATIEVTTKGNGFLSVGGALLGQVYDDHDDGATFEGILADIVLADLNSDGFKDVVISGVKNINHEKTGDVLDRGAFVRIYLYDREQQTFNKVYDSNDPDE